MTNGKQSDFKRLERAAPKWIAHRAAPGRATAALALLLAGCVPYSLAQEPGQRTFSSAEQAGTALFSAAQSETEGAVLDILGRSAKQIIFSGDPDEDMSQRTTFVIKYEQMHRYAQEADGTTVLYVGDEDRAFPIPIANKNGVWYFDTDAGKREILARRIQKNQQAAIDACRQLVDAEKQYDQKIRQRGLAAHYAQRFVSEKGRYDGLFWYATGDERDSPLDPIIASAGQDNPASVNDYAGVPLPFNGYYFRVLTGQGHAAPGGAKSYLAGGEMVAGFAFVAYPAEYGSTGVMTLIVDQSGVVYEKDLGRDTAKLAAAMTEYNPDSTWRKVNSSPEMSQD
jgi:Protein of unknown function (DUF2950)